VSERFRSELDGGPSQRPPTTQGPGNRLLGRILRLAAREYGRGRRRVSGVGVVDADADICGRPKRPSCRCFSITSIRRTVKTNRPRRKTG